MKRYGKNSICACLLATDNVAVLSRFFFFLHRFLLIFKVVNFPLEGEKQQAGNQSFENLQANYTKNSQ